MAKREAAVILYQNRETIRRALRWVSALVIVSLAQDTLLSFISAYGVSAMLVPVLVAACGFFEDGLWGGIFGIFAGYFADMANPGSTVMYTIAFTVIGFGAGMLSHYFVNRKFLPYVCVSAAALIVTALFQMLRPLVFFGAKLPDTLWVMFVQLLLTMPWALLLYPALRRAQH